MPMGGLELLILLVIILLFFGAKRIPELARSLGRGQREFRRGIGKGAGEAEAEESDKAEARERGEKKEAPPPEDIRSEEPTSQKGDDTRVERSSKT